MRRILLAPVLILSAVLALRAAQAPSRPAESAAPAEAIRLNNLGVASMNQQKFEQGLQWFEKAAAADAKLVAARLNQAIALINLQRYDPARELLVEVDDSDPQNARAWYNLGLLQKSTGEAEAALASFAEGRGLEARRRAQPLLRRSDGGADPARYDDAVALVHASAGDRSLPRVRGVRSRARVSTRGTAPRRRRAHLERFQRLTTEKIASAMSLGYGDQGPLSLAEALVPKGGAAPPACPVKFVAAAPGPFACRSRRGRDRKRRQRGWMPVRRRWRRRERLPRAEPAGGTGQAGRCRGAVPRRGRRHVRARCATGLTRRRSRSGVRRPITTTMRSRTWRSGRSAALRCFTTKVAAASSTLTAKSGLPESPAAGAAHPLGLTWIDYDHDNDVDLIVPVAHAALSAGRTGAGPGPATPSPAGRVSVGTRRCGATTATARSPKSARSAASAAHGANRSGRGHRLQQRPRHRSRGDGRRASPSCGSTRGKADSRRSTGRPPRTRPPSASSCSTSTRTAGWTWRSRTRARRACRSGATWRASAWSRSRFPI